MFAPNRITQKFPNSALWFIYTVHIVARWLFRNSTTVAAGCLLWIANTEILKRQLWLFFCIVNILAWWLLRNSTTVAAGCLLRIANMSSGCALSKLVLHCVATCCSMLPCVAECVSCVATCCSAAIANISCGCVLSQVLLQYTAVCCSVLQHFPACGSMWRVSLACFQCVRRVFEAYCSVLQYVAVWCGVLQCVAVCCRAVIDNTICGCAPSKVVLQGVTIFL